jgi:hypothetical protein
MGRKRQSVALDLERDGRLFAPQEIDRARDPGGDFRRFAAKARPSGDARRAAELAPVELDVDILDQEVGCREFIFETRAAVDERDIAEPRFVR